MLQQALCPATGGSERVEMLSGPDSATEGEVELEAGGAVLPVFRIQVPLRDLVVEHGAVYVPGAWVLRPEVFELMREDIDDRYFLIHEL
jgi:hypothetical protein